MNYPYIIKIKRDIKGKFLVQVHMKGRTEVFRCEHREAAMLGAFKAVKDITKSLGASGRVGSTARKTS